MLVWHRHKHYHLHRVIAQGTSSRYNVMLRFQCSYSAGVVPVPCQYSKVQCSAAQRSAAQYSTVQHSTAQHSTAQYSTVLYSTVQYSTVQYSIININITIMIISICNSIVYIVIVTAGAGGEPRDRGRDPRGRECNIVIELSSAIVLYTI